MHVIPRAPRRASLLAMLALAAAAPAAEAATTHSLSGESSRVVDGRFFAKAGSTVTSAVQTDVDGSICGSFYRPSGNQHLDGDPTFGSWTTGADGLRRNTVSFATKQVPAGVITTVWRIRSLADSGECLLADNIIEASDGQDVHLDGAGPTRSATITQAGATSSYWFTGAAPVDVAWSAPNDGTGVGVAHDHPAAPGESVDAEGRHEVAATASDLLGNERTSEAGFGIDRTLPTAAAKVTPDASSAGWHRDTAKVELTGADAAPGSGLYKLHWSVDGGPQQLGYYDDDNVVEVAKAGTTRITYRAEDRAGLKSAAKTVEVHIDRIAPTIAATAEGASPSGWHADEATVALRAQDEGGSGVDKVLYTVDGAAEKSVDGASTDIELTGDGSHSVAYRTVDRAGNASEQQTMTVLVDGTDPAAQAAVDPEPVAAGWHADDVTVKLTATDAHSGVESIMWAIGDEKATVDGDAANVPVTREGTTEVRYRAKDRAGNVGETKSITVRIDRTGPEVTCPVVPASLWPPNGAMRPVAVDVGVTDALSGPAGFVLTSASSDEPGDEQDIDGFATGTPDVEGLLRAKRRGSGDGRSYALVYEARDVVGNRATCTAQVAVAHDRRR